jgi:hypothetical protein
MKIRGGKIIGTKLIISRALAKLELQHTKYLSNLSIWDQYIVFVYTLGSQPVNRRLVGVPVTPKLANRWTFELFKNYQYGIKNIGRPFKKMAEYFINPNKFIYLSESLKNEITEEALELYTQNLQRIIMQAPVTSGNITVYKASTPYDEKLLQNSGFPFLLPQPPFNSTSFDPNFDFNAFLGSNSDTCCLWKITIPKGSHVLAIAHPFQAYLTEREVLLPIGSIFEVTGFKNVQLSYWNKREAPIKVQHSPYYIGEIYQHDNWESRSQSVRSVRMLNAIFHNS